MFLHSVSRRNNGLFISVLGEHGVLYEVAWSHLGAPRAAARPRGGGGARARERRLGCVCAPPPALAPHGAPASDVVCAPRALKKYTTRARS